MAKATSTPSKVTGEPKVEIVKAATLLTAGAYYNTYLYSGKPLPAAICDSMRDLHEGSMVVEELSVQSGVLCIKLDGGSVLKYHGDFVEIS